MKKATRTKAKAKGKKGTGATLTLVQVKSGICTPKDQKATLVGLGLARIGQRVVREDDPAIRGMVRKVRHLVQIVND